MKSRFRVVSLVLVAVLGLALLGCTAQKPEGKAYASALDGTVTLTLYFGNAQADALIKETRVVEKSNVPLELVVLNELIKGPGTPEGRKTIPAEAKMLSVKVEGGIAYVDFSKELVEKHWGGSAGDSMSIDSIVFSLTEIPAIEKVQLLLEGKKQEAMFGHIATDKPIGR